MRFYSKTRRPPQIIIVPLIDILCLLLIFFMLSTTFKQQQPAVRIDLSQAEHATTVSANVPVIVHVTRDNNVFVEDKPVSVAELAATLKGIRGAKPDALFALKADKVSDFGVIIKVLDAFKDAGIDDVPAFTEAKDGAAPPP